MAELLRLGLERILDETGVRDRIERAKQSTGGFRSGHGHTSDDHDAVLSEAARW